MIEHENNKNKTLISGSSIPVLRGLLVLRGVVRILIIFPDRPMFSHII